MVLIIHINTAHSCPVLGTVVCCINNYTAILPVCLATFRVEKCAEVFHEQDLAGLIIPKGFCTVQQMFSSIICNNFVYNKIFRNQNLEKQETMSLIK